MKKIMFFVLFCFWIIVGSLFVFHDSIFPKPKIVEVEKEVIKYKDVIKEVEVEKKIYVKEFEGIEVNLFKENVGELLVVDFKNGWWNITQQENKIICRRTK